MKVKKIFVDLIKSHEKTIELRRVNKLNELIPFKYKEKNNLYLFTQNGRLKIPIFDNETNNYLGTVTINGYEIIKKEWLFNLLNQIIDDVNDNYDSESIYSLDENIDTALEEIQFNQLSNNKLPSWVFSNINWLIEIFENNDGENYWQDFRINPFIEEYFKDEEEILVLPIESWEE